MSICGSCKRPIIWAVTEKGKRIPVDVETVPEGNVVLEDRPGHAPLARVVGKGRGDRISHFATCPNAKEHRRR